MNGDDKNKIDKLNSSLYSRTSPEVRAKRKVKFHREDLYVKDDWDGPKEEFSDVKLNNVYIKSGMSFFTKFLIASFIFFVLSVGFGLFLIINGSNIVSADNVDIEIRGPASVSGGDKVSFNIQIYNENNVTLKLVDLIIDYPSGTIDPKETTKELEDYRKLIGEVSPGGIAARDFEAIIYGEENKKKEILVRLEYRVEGSNAVFKKEKIYDILISSSPISLGVESFKEITSNQDLPIELTLKSNSKEVIRNLIIKATYPFGFKFEDSNPKTTISNNIWKIGDLPPGGSQKIIINGRIQGENEDERVFRFSAGSWNPTNTNEIGAEFIAQTHDITIRKPFVSLEVTVDGSNEEEVPGQFNDSVPVEISWFNNLNEQINDAEIRVKLSGSAYDKRSVNPGNGIFISANDEIVWNKQTIGSLARIEPGEGGDLRFNLTPRDLSSVGKLATNPNINIDVSVSGKRITEGNVPENIKSGAGSVLKVASIIGFTSEVARSIGPFENSGPVPPEPEKETTYTIIWSASNGANEVTGATVKATLPPYVKWKNLVSPERENIVFNENNNTITWNIGTISPYTGIESRRKEVAFQVSIVPSITDSGRNINILNKSVFTAFDEFSGVNLSTENNPLDTRFANDPSYKQGDEIVK